MGKAVEILILFFCCLQGSVSPGVTHQALCDVYSAAACLYVNWIESVYCGLVFLAVTVSLAPRQAEVFCKRQQCYSAPKSHLEKSSSED